MENGFEERVMGIDLILLIIYSFMCFHFTHNNYVFIIYLWNKKHIQIKKKLEPIEVHCMPKSLH